MHAAMAVAFAMVLVAWPLGQWQAKAWLRKNMAPRNEGGNHPQSEERLLPSNQRYDM